MKNEEVFERVKIATGKHTVRELSKLFDISGSAIRKWGVTGVPFSTVIPFFEEHDMNVNYNWLVTGEGQPFRSISDKEQIVLAEAGKRVMEALELLRDKGLVICPKCDGHSDDKYAGGDMTGL